MGDGRVDEAHLVRLALLRVVVANDPHASPGGEEPVGTLLLPPDRLPVDGVAALQRVLAGAPLLALRRHHEQRGGLGAHRDGVVLSEDFSLQAQPRADHVFWHESRVGGLAVDHAPRALEVPLSGVAATDNPHAVGARIQPTLAADVLPQGLAVDGLVGHGHVLSGTPPLPVRGDDVQGRGLDADRDCGVLVKLRAAQAQPGAADLVRHDTPVRLLGVHDASGAVEVLLLGVVAADDPGAGAAGVEPAPAALLLPHRLAVCRLPGHHDVLAGTPVLPVGRDDAQGVWPVELCGHGDLGVFHKLVALEPHPNVGDPVWRQLPMEDPAEEHATLALKVLLLHVVGTDDPHAIDAGVQPVAAPGLSPDRVAIGSFVSEQGVLPGAALLPIRREDVQRGGRGRHAGCR
mmetsp:Transcript_1536/g.4928  ORF Transcript_1536/g.4928 Transcript_1536/m.4928 type:complete len:404 (-) Transcript_1536:5-1216(-)